MRSGELTPILRQQTLYKSIEGEQLLMDEIVDVSGSPSTWTDALFVNEATKTTDSWSRGQAATKRTYTLHTTIPTELRAQDTPIVFPSDFHYSLNTVFATPQPTTDWSSQLDTTLEDSYVSLSPCADLLPITSSYGKRVTTIDFGKDRTATSTYWWPPGPTGITAGYTAPLVKFEHTVIEGFTAAPITLTGFYSQTYRPQHHNFSEDFYFDFLLEPGISAEVMDELRAIDVRALIQIYDQTYTVGFDGTVRKLGAVTE